MRPVHYILLLAALAWWGCSDPLAAPPDRFWEGRGSILFTQGLTLDNPGTIATINTDGTGLASLFSGAIPCSPRQSTVAYADATLLSSATWAIYLANIDGTGTPVHLAGGAGTRRPNFGIVDLSPDASKVVFVLQDFVNGKSLLYVINADGTGQNLLSDRAVNSTAVAISPDGRMVAFYAGSQQNEVDVADLATGAVTVVARNARPWSVENVSWSPDGARIAFVGAADSEPAGTRNIYFVNPDGSNRHAITSDAGADNLWPVWSPDGSQLAYIHDRELWTMRPDGSARRQITFASAWPYQVKVFPQWSPDGSMILFTAVAGNGVQGLLQVVDIATLRVNALATGAARGFWR